MGTSGGKETFCGNVDRKEFRELKKQIKESERFLRTNVITEGLRKFDQLNSKQQKQFLKIACKQLNGISWESVKDKPLFEIKSLVEKRLEQRITQQQAKIQQLPPKKISYGKSSNHGEVTNASFKSPEIQETINTTQDALSSTLQGSPDKITFTENEKGKIEKLKKMVQAHIKMIQKVQNDPESTETYDLSKDTQEMLSTVPGTIQYFQGFLKEIQDHRSFKEDSNLKEGKDYISDAGMLNHIIIPMLTICEQLPDHMKTDEQVLPIIQEIRKECIKYV